jgi:hypothetical protein
MPSTDSSRRRRRRPRDRRDRVWRVTAPQGLNVDLGKLATAAGGDAAVRVFRQQASARVHELVERAFRHEDEGDAHITLTDMALRPSPAEASALAAELHDVADGWRDRTRDDEGTGQKAPHGAPTRSSSCFCPPRTRLPHQSARSRALTTPDHASPRLTTPRRA